jgi:propionate CoA-transferase
VSKITSVDQVAKLIPDGATVGVVGFAMMGWAEEVGEAIEKRFLATGEPKNITLVHGCAIGDWKLRGIGRFGHVGLTKRYIGAIVGASPAMAKLVAGGKIEGYCLPQGVIVQLYREIAAHRPGIITKIGLGTFVDPRLEGGKMNSFTTEEIVRVIEIDGEEYLFYKSFPINVAIIKGDSVDERGNLTMEREAARLEALPLAQAAKNSGGIVIAQAEFLAQPGTLNPKDVGVPGILVDHAIIASTSEYCWQTEAFYFNPAYSGSLKAKGNTIPPLALDERKIIARRAAMELVPDAVVNLGVGIPSDIGAIAAEENVSDLMTLTTEAGVIGGIPASLPDFGASYNPEAIVAHHEQFDYYDGGGIDVSFLGLAQTDEKGNINVSKFNGRANGCGGFINITQAAKKVVFCGSFTAGGLKVSAGEGALVIEQEGKNKKFLKQVEQVTFSGTMAAKIKQPVIYVTERAVFTLKNGVMTLTEIAPGVNLEKDILAQMEFTPRISPQLRVMPAEIFRPGWGGLRQLIQSKPAQSVNASIDHPSQAVVVGQGV